MEGFDAFLSLTVAVLLLQVSFPSTVLGKSEDWHQSQNDISDDKNILTVGGNLKDEGIQDLDYTDGLYAMGPSNGDSSYYYFVYDPDVLFDPSSPYYVGAYDSRPPSSQDAQLDESSEEEYEEPSTESNFDNFMMGVPAQLQSFQMFNPDEEFKRAAAEREQRMKELEERSRASNSLGELVESSFRSKRSFSSSLNAKMSGNAKEAGLRNSENIDLNANCRGGGGGGGGRGRGGAENVPGVGDAANGVDSAAGAVQNAAGDVAGAAGNAVDAASDAAENLRLRAGRRSSNRRGGRNRNRQA